MKALVYAGPKQVEVQEVKEPEKQDGKVDQILVFTLEHIQEQKHH